MVKLISGGIRNVQSMQNIRNIFYPIPLFVFHFPILFDRYVHFPPLIAPEVCFPVKLFNR